MTAAELYMNIPHHKTCECSACVSVRAGSGEIRFQSYVTTNSVIMLESVQFDGTGWQVYYRVETRSGKTVYGKTTVRNWIERSERWRAKS